MSSTDKVLDTLVSRAKVISEFCQKSRPADLSSDDLSTKQEVLYLLEQDHKKFKGAAEGKVKADAVDDDDSTSKGRYRLALTAAQKKKDNDVRSAIALCKMQGYEAKGKDI